MLDREFKVARLALVSFIGAMILEIVLIFALGLREAFTIRQIPAHLAALVVGALAGWLFELFREITSTTAETLRVAQQMQTNFEAFTAKITYQDKAFDMLMACPRHNDALSQLIKASVSDNYRRIPLVGVPDYFNFLKRAIAHSDGYEGIQRKPLTWFKETGGGGYLGELKERKMKYKTRLFIIDETDRVQWEADLINDECLNYYWQHTGIVVTYWMYTEDFLAMFPSLRTPPEDLALYDRQLLISYDESARLLSFDVLGGDSDIIRIFRTIDQLARNRIPVLHELSARKSSVGRRVLEGRRSDAAPPQS
jgi:hypothetical protein